MSDIEKIINYVMNKVERLENADKATTVKTLAQLETTLTAVQRAVTALPYYQSEAISAIIGEERGETSES